ncbi:hypothetical protein C5167_011282 [Papaver somniferum]|uniref:Uncharacterized protein n=1 Tax=Papaver somniferum TaxID=3469 RepID=A0A4Y7K5V3_PAPSO|nr:uncharacterized protein LOC113289836 [Papaver somniferum]RZC67591.1 hypothetical protein C5167_011282 [Papaver somniferum]
MCNSKAKNNWKATTTSTIVDTPVTPPPVSQMDGRPVLQPAGNRVACLDRRNSLKKVSLKTPPPPTSTTKTKPSSSTTSSPPISPKSKSPRPPALKRGNDPNGLNSSIDKSLTPRLTTPKLTPTLVRKKSKKSLTINVNNSISPMTSSSTTKTIERSSSFNYPSSLIVESPGSIAAARREQVTLIQAQRKMKIAHYGRSKSAKFEGNIIPVIDTSSNTLVTSPREKRCSFITGNSDPLYITYHDEEWGVPLRDDKLLFEMLVLSGAQVGSDWTSILKKRQDFRDAFSGFDPEIVANLNERRITSISTEYGIELSRVRGAVDNSKRILEIQREFGSFGNYLWGFVNNKPISTQYKSSHKIPVKTSKSETISKDMVRRGFRGVGPTVMHSFMQAAGLRNDHLINCPRHLQCVAAEASHRSMVSPAV